MGRWLARAALMLLGLALAIALLVAGEFALRFLDVGHATTFLVRVANVGYTTNPRFTDAYFPPWAEIQPAPAVLPESKEPGTYRIFVIGGSAAFGDLLPEYSMARILEVMLRDSMDGRRYEVVNAATLGVHSSMAVDIARDVARHQPDLLLVYTGHNEVVGPGGPGALLQGVEATTAGTDSWLAQKAVGLRFTRLGQLLGRMATAVQSHRVTGVTTQPELRTLEQARVPLDDPRLPEVYRGFRVHLMEILEVGRAAHADVMLCTVASNLTGQPPLSSMHRKGLGEEEQRQFETRMSLAVKTLRQGAPARALQTLLLATAIDDEFAEVHFRLGRALTRSGRHEAARSEFLRARDLDAQRYRADTEINRIIREVATTQGAWLLDVEHLLAASASAPVGLPGNEFFYDHVHLNFDGNYTVARSIFDALQERPEHEGRKAAGREAVATSLALTDWDRLRVRALIARRHRNPLLAGRRPPPYDRRSARLRTAPLADALATYRSALERTPQDLYLRRNLGWLLRDLDQLDAAREEFQHLIAQTPNLTLWRTELATLLLAQGKEEDAIAVLRTALQQDPRDFRAHRLLGQALAAAGKNEAAIGSLRNALRLHPYLRDARLQLALLLFDVERYEEAIPQLQALADTPQKNDTAELTDKLQRARERAGQQP